MRDSDKVSNVLKKMKWWPWANNGVFVMDEEETRVVMAALDRLERRKKQSHDRYLRHQEEVKVRSKENYQKRKAEVFKR